MLSVPSDGWLIRKSPNGKNKTRRRDRRAPGLISGVILANELFRSTTLLAPESQEVGLAISHLVGGEQHGKVASWAKRVLAKCPAGTVKIPDRAASCDAPCGATTQLS